MFSLRQNVLRANPVLRASSSVIKPASLRAIPRLVGDSRLVTTQATTSEQAYEILKGQRKRRPQSPDLAIYQPQLTWYLSGFHRITGLTLAFPFYGFLLAYIAGPLVGLGFDSNTLVNFAAALPLVVKIPLKFLASIPFTFHAFNGCRHLIWDTASQLTLKGVYRTGWTVVGLSAVSSLILAFL